MECASTMKYWRNTIKTKAQGLILDKEDIIQQQRDRDKIMNRVSEIKREVEQFNQNAEDYNKDNRVIILNTNCKTSISFLAEIYNLVTEKQKVTDKLDVVQKLKDSFRGNNL